jgi:chemotaxis protein MotB
VIGKVVAPLPNDVVVEGYTDSLPIVGGPFSSNFELSAVRAVTVLEQLMRVDGVPADRLSATGYGDTHPIVPNNSPANMALNRRVDVVILNTSSSDRL